MQTETSKTETLALVANDIKVLTAQLNDAIKNGAEKGLRVEISCLGIIDIKGTATHYPAVSVRVLAEVH